MGLFGGSEAKVELQLPDPPHVAWASLREVVGEHPSITGAAVVATGEEPPRLVAFVAPEATDAALAALAAAPGCEGASEIGVVRADPPGLVLVETAFGGRRVMDELVGDPLPRIC